MTDKSIIVYRFSISTCMTWSTNHPKLTNHLTYFQSWQPHPQLPAGAEHLPPPLTHHQTQLHQNHHMTEVRSTPSTFDWSCDCCSKVAFPNHPCQNSLPSQGPSRGPKHTPVSKVASCWTMKFVTLAEQTKTFMLGRNPSNFMSEKIRWSLIIPGRIVCWILELLGAFNAVMKEMTDAWSAFVRAVSDAWTWRAKLVQLHSHYCILAVQYMYHTTQDLGSGERLCCCRAFLQDRQTGNKCSILNRMNDSFVSVGLSSYFLGVGN